MLLRPGGVEGGATAGDDAGVLARAPLDETPTTAPVPCLMADLLAVHERDLRSPGVRGPVDLDGEHGRPGVITTAWACAGGTLRLMT